MNVLKKIAAAIAIVIRYNKADSRVFIFTLASLCLFWMPLVYSIMNISYGFMSAGQLTMLWIGCIISMVPTAILWKSINESALLIWMKAIDTH